MHLFNRSQSEAKQKKYENYARKILTSGALVMNLKKKWFYALKPFILSA